MLITETKLKLIAAAASIGDFSLERIKEKTIKLARELERLISDAPGGAQRILRRIAEGSLGLIQIPRIDTLTGRFSRTLERLAEAIVDAALVIGGSMLVLASLRGWHHILGEIMVVTGIFGIFLISIGAVSRAHGRR